ncbi:MAG: hypothetical protein KGQ66_11915 [Acidobacteriota bacterium]|nr:hypothetical protein [Acidobacteriota bacterium]
MSFCSGCGRGTAECPRGGQCTGRFEPPRYCGSCGRRMRVVVTPAGWRARCRDHGEVGAGAAPSTHHPRKPS